MASPVSSPVKTPTPSIDPVYPDVTQTVVTSASHLLSPDFSPVHVAASKLLALVVSNEPPVPPTHILPGEEGNAIDLDKSPNVKEIAEAFGPIGDPTAKRSKSLRGYNPKLTSGVKKSKIHMEEEGGSLQYSSTSYIPSSDDEETPHLLVKRDVGPSAMLTLAPPATETPQAVFPSLPSHVHSPICEHAPHDIDSHESHVIDSNMTLIAFLANFKTTSFQPDPPQQESS